MLVGTRLIIFGFCGIYGAQIPAKYDSAEFVSSWEELQAWTQDSNLVVNSCEGQKHAASLLEVQWGMSSQVFKHLGTIAGQAGVSGGPGMVGTVTGAVVSAGRGMV